MIRLAALALALVLAAPALHPGPLAQAGSAEETAAAEREWLFESLRTAPTERLGRFVEDQIWRYWLRRAPDKDSYDMMRKAMRRRSAYDYAGALELLDRLKARAPDWAEVWNQRATVLFHQEKYEAALEAIERTLALEPKHFGALAGKGLIYLRQGRGELARKALRRAVAIHPWLKERHMLATEPPGENL